MNRATALAAIASALAVTAAPALVLTLVALVGLGLLSQRGMIGAGWFGEWSGRRVRLVRRGWWGATALVLLVLATAYAAIPHDPRADRVAGSGAGPAFNQEQLQAEYALRDDYAGAIAPLLWVAVLWLWGSALLWFGWRVELV